MEVSGYTICVKVDIASPGLAHVCRVKNDHVDATRHRSSPASPPYQSTITQSLSLIQPYNDFKSICNNMAVKRKRSDSTISPYSTSSSTNTTSRDASSSPSPDVQMSDSVSQWPNVNPSQYAQSARMNSRTRKRFRDNRPDENTIYGLSTTLYPLYQGQDIQLTVFSL